MVQLNQKPNLRSDFNTLRRVFGKLIIVFPKNSPYNTSNTILVIKTLKTFQKTRFSTVLKSIDNVTNIVRRVFWKSQ
jgi:hypothetical protein